MMNTATRTIFMPPSVVTQITGLPDLPMGEIKALWKALFNTDNPNHSRPFLERRIAYRLQEIEYRKVEPGVLKRNNEKIAQLIEYGKLKTQKADSSPVSGTVFCREYRGVEHQVRVLPDGQYEFEGRPYGSLSVIAREITGTRWSGPLFFGLKKPGRAVADKNKGGRR